MIEQRCFQTAYGFDPATGGVIATIKICGDEGRYSARLRIRVRVCFSLAGHRLCQHINFSINTTADINVEPNGDRIIVIRMLTKDLPDADERYLVVESIDEPDWSVEFDCGEAMLQSLRKSLN